MKQHKELRQKENIIHTSNNILTTINLSIELLTREVYGTLNSPQKKQLKTALSEIKKLEILLKKLEKK